MKGLHQDEMVENVGQEEKENGMKIFLYMNELLLELAPKISFYFSVCIGRNKVNINKRH